MSIIFVYFKIFQFELCRRIVYRFVDFCNFNYLFCSPLLLLLSLPLVPLFVHRSTVFLIVVVAAAAVKVFCLCSRCRCTLAASDC